MELSIAAIEDALMDLPAEERARIARRLIRSLSVDKAALSRKKWQAAWLAKVKRREAELDRGREIMLTHEDVMASLKSVIQ